MRPRSDSLLVWTGASCVYGCGACPIQPPTEIGGLSRADLRRGLAMLPARSGRLVILVGGEPILRHDFHPLIATIRALDCAAGIVTTGRPLLYAQQRAKLRHLGISYLRVQLFGFGGNHDRTVAVPGAFEQTLEALRAWCEESTGDCDVDVALSVRGRSLEVAVAELDDLARALPSREINLILALEPSDLPAPADAERAIAPLAHWNDDPTRPLLMCEAMPLPFASQFVAPAPSPQFLGGVPRACCLGTIAGLAAASQPQPEQVRANSFNFIRTPLSVGRAHIAEQCQAHAAAGGADPARSVWLVEDEHVVLHVTDTGDFTTNEIARVKTDLSHLFFDRARPGVLDDFKEGMRRLLPDPICERCDHREHCARRYHVIEGPPFAREEQWISAHLAQLKGRVLDVGCGEQLYRDVLFPLVRNRTITYTGLDPDEVSLNDLRTALPEGHFLLGGIEDFSATTATYDHILSLRSLNHVFDLDEALARMAELLKPGGQLLLVETTPFAMLRRPEQVAAADRAPRAGHQHFRNVSSDELLPLARRRGLRVIEHQPASLQTSNEWILLLEK